MLSRISTAIERYLAMRPATILIPLLAMTFLSNNGAFSDDSQQPLNAQSQVTANWFATQCNGILRTDLGQTNQTDNKLTQLLSGKWKNASPAERENICYKSLILFGPKGTQSPGLLTATPELQEKLPIDTKKLLGF